MHYLFFFFSKVAVLAMGTWSKNLSRSIFVSRSDQEEDQYTSVNKDPRPYQHGFTACIHWDMNVKTVVQFSDDAQKGALILVSTLFHNK